MLDVTLNRDEVEGDGFVNIGSVASAIARAIRTSNLAQAERKLFWRVNSGVQLGLLNPLDPETLEPLSREDYGMGVVPFPELVKWGHATELFNFKSEFISPAAVPWARAAPSMRDMVAAAQAKAAPVVTQEPQAAPVTTKSASTGNDERRIENACEPAKRLEMHDRLLLIARDRLRNRPGAAPDEPEEMTTPSLPATTPGPAPVVAAKRNKKKPSIETVALDYMRAEFKQAQFESAAKFHKHLIKTAGVTDSPFEMGTGVNARKLFCPAASSFFDAGTLGKLWPKIRAA